MRDIDVPESPQSWRRDRSTSCMRKGWRYLGLFSLEKKRLRRDLNIYKYLKENCKDDGARLVSGAQWQDKKKRAQTETQEVPSEHKEILFYCNDDWALEQVAQRGGVSFLGDTQKPAGHGPDQPGLGGPAWAGGLDSMTSRGPLQPQPFPNSVKKRKHSFEKRQSLFIFFLI